MITRVPARLGGLDSRVKVRHARFPPFRVRSMCLPNAINCSALKQDHLIT